MDYFIGQGHILHNYKTRGSPLLPCLDLVQSALAIS